MSERRDLHFSTHEELWRWSVADLEGFWSAVWEFFGVISHAPYSRVLDSRRMPGARWFPGALLNYAETIRTVPSHRALALFRGRNAGVLMVKLGLGEELDAQVQLIILHRKPALRQPAHARP